jgi:microcystin-dependent protein
MLNKRVLSVFCLVYLMATAHTGFAQVGFNTPTPHPSSVVDISSTNKGLLLPRMSSAQRAAMAIASPNPAQGLLVYDTDVNRFFYWDGAVTAWRPVNFADVKEYSGNEVVHIKTQMTVGSGYTNIAPPSNGMLVQGNMGVGTNAPVAGNKVHVHGNARIDSTLEVRNVNITNPVGAGTVPQGGIIMWSGSTPPTGWALCNGSNGTPDLRGRFVVGYNPLVADYDQPGNKSTGGLLDGKIGGLHEVTLTTAQIPAHNHSGTTNTAGGHTHTEQRYSPNCGDVVASGKSGCWLNRPGTIVTQNTSWSGDHFHTLNLDNTGGGQAHENRPPYYVLAYIMKL